MSKATRLYNYTVYDLTKDRDFQMWVCSTSSRCASGGGGETITAGSGNYIDNGVLNLGLNLSTLGTTNEGLVTQSLYLSTPGLETSQASLIVLEPSTGDISLAAQGGGSLSSGLDIRKADQEVQLGVTNGGSHSDVLIHFDSILLQTNGSISLSTGDTLKIGGSTGLFPGAEYQEDYSSLYTDRSLVDKGWVLDTLNSTGVGQTTPNQVTQATSFNLTAGTYTTFNGTIAPTATLPPVAGSTGTRIAVLNASTVDVTVVTNTGGNDIMDSGTAQNTSTISAGSARILYNNSLFWFFIT